MRPCWYRYFVEEATAPLFDSPASIRTACVGLRGLQRYGCVSAAALAIPEDPLGADAHLRAARARDAGACLRGVAVQALERSPAATARALRAVRANAARRDGRDCERWFGRTLALVTDGRFRCPDRACSAGRGTDPRAARDFLLSPPVSSAKVSATKGGAAQMTESALAGTSVRF